MSKPLSSCRLAFIGGGNMASAIIGGLLSKGLGKENIIVSAPSSGTREALEAKGTSVTPSNVEAARGADVIILAVKPAVASSVCEELRSAWSQLGDGNPVIVSVAAGVTASSLRGWLGGNDGVTIPIVRVMPNTPSLVGEGASGAFADENVKEHQRQLVDSILSSICKATEWVDKEELLDVVTAISGSGPAYYFAMVEHMIASGVALGLPPAQAASLAKQTCLGAGKMLTESDDAPEELRRKVTSPNGTTAAGLASLEESGLKEVAHKCVQAAASRAEELGKLYKA